MKVVASSQCHNDSFKLVCLRTDGSTNSPTGRACSGDSGGYAGARNFNDQAVQYGVASFVYVNSGACIEPNAYTDVAYHIDWINQQMAANWKKHKYEKHESDFFPNSFIS